MYVLTFSALCMIIYLLLFIYLFIIFLQCFILGLHFQIGSFFLQNFDF